MRCYIGGTFDLFHVGHVNLFRLAKHKFGHVIVSLNTDEFCGRYKRKPVMSFEERMAPILACRYVDEVTVNDGCEDSKPAILRTKPDVIVHGDDWQGPALMAQMGLAEEFLRQNDISMFYMPYTRDISTTDIINRIKGI